MPNDAFEEIVEEALMSLPEEFSRKLENIEVVVEDEPSEELLRKLGLRRGALLGLYHGVPLKRRSVWAAPTLPGRISIYRNAILATSRAREDIRRRIREVVIHEIGHHFGLSDRDMRSTGHRSPAEERPHERDRRRESRDGRER
jgi:predicted Zn-dependent protease with MMP-like domain